ncbi:MULTISPECIES: Crp/Fnr family transcriptional regulator [Streptomyces]|uniref:Crp/Fnr family transcriptional regulator n=1 Tax=Streptomyces luteosporeus TaxID=173856 RepID=A0ABN3TUQ5_9ACTN
MTGEPAPDRESPIPPALTMRELVSEETWADFRRQSFERPHPRGDVLLQQGDDGTHVLAVLCGLTKVEHTARNGSVNLLAFRGPGELLGELATMGRCGRLASVTTLSRCRVAVMHAAAFTKFVTDHDLYPALLHFAQARLRESTPDGAGLGQRLAATLVRVADMLVASGNDAGRPLVLPLRRRELASYLVTHRNNVSDQLRELRRFGVRGHRSSIVVEDLSALRQALETLYE